MKKMNKNILIYFITKMNTNAVQLHTVFLLVGPHQCGKTTFATTKLIPKLRECSSGQANIQYLSTDDIRRSLLGQSDLNKLQMTMLESSQQAFDLLYYTLQSLTSFPINAHFIIIDSTGLSADFRQNISNICQKNNYNLDLVFFNYTEKDYFSYAGGDRHLISKHILKFRRAISELKGLVVNFKHSIKNQNVNLDNMKIENWDLYQSLKLDPTKSYFVVGDIHTCLEEFKGLICKAGFVIDENDIVKRGPKVKNSEIILVGDLIDKGSRNKATIDFFYRNLSQDDNIINIVVGNHEQTVHGLLTGRKTEYQYSKELIVNYFNSYFEMKSDQETQTQFLWLYNKMKPFLWYRSEDNNSRSFFVTHAPCSLSKLGKLDTRSLKAQSYCYIDRQKDFQEQFSQITGSVRNANCYPYHVFGHVALDKPYTGDHDNNNQIGLDTGCIHGNNLTGIWLGKRYQNGKPIFLKQAFLGAQLPVLETLNRLQFKKQEDGMASDKKGKGDGDGDGDGNGTVDVTSRLLTLSIDNQSRIRHLLQNQINFISGTISPADKDENDFIRDAVEASASASASASSVSVDTRASVSSGLGILEGLEQGLLYYQRRGVNEVVIETKYMGSRCNVYLDVECPGNSFSVSRNGYRISNHKVAHCEMLELVYHPLLERLDSFIKKHQIKKLIIDGELMPWSALGGGLIDNTFRAIDTCLHGELYLLEKTGFPDIFTKTRDEINKTDFAVKSNNTKKSEMKKGFGDTTFGTYDSIMSLQKEGVQFEMTHEREMADTYHKQVEMFGMSDRLHFKPFNILKVTMKDQVEIIPFYLNDTLYLSQNQIFTLLTGDISHREHHLFNLDDKASFDKAREFYDQLTGDGDGDGDNYEGVVIKPNHYPKELNYAPFLKVRNSRYLSIIYGYNYREPLYYAKLIKQKNIYKKVQNSIRDYNIGLEMLKYSQDEINEDNSKYVNLLVDFIFGEEDTKDIDPRL